MCHNCRSLDRDGSGKITVNELQESLAGLGVPIDASTAERMVDMIDVDGSSDISFQEFRRFAILLPRSQASLSMALTLFLECLNGCRQASISKKCLCLFKKTQKGRSPVGALRQKNSIPADGVATACHQDLCFSQRCRHYALLVMLHLLSAIQQH